MAHVARMLYLKPTLAIICIWLAGNRTSQALLGIQLNPRDLEDFTEATKSLEAEFTFTTLAGEARRVFDMFIQ